jgi:hypothetical protein
MHRRLPIAKEILMIILIKMILLFIIWLACFSNPPDPHFMPSKVAFHLFNINLDHNV